jgi:uncharacterized protein
MSPGRARIEMPHERIADFCRRRHIRWLALGSVLRDDFRPDSDADILVEFEPGTRLGFAFFDVQEEPEIPVLIAVLERALPGHVS